MTGKDVMFSETHSNTILKGHMPYHENDTNYNHHCTTTIINQNRNVPFALSASDVAAGILLFLLSSNFKPKI